MNYRAWLETLRRRLDEWNTPENDRLELLSLLANSPLEDTTLGEAVQRLGAQPPLELLRFYTTAANGCDIEFLIQPSHNFKYSGRENERVSPSISAGIAVAPIDLLGTLRASLRTHWGSSRFVDPFCEVAWPFSQTAGGDLLVIVDTGEKLTHGIYSLRMPLMMEAEFSKRYCGTFSEWLVFLEANCYVGTDWYEVNLWHDGNILRHNPRHSAQLEQILSNSLPERP